jgi:serine/threonine-protein kinase
MTGPGAVLAQRYRLDERVGGGAMGEVWRGTDTSLDRTIAIKIVRPELIEEPGFRERFLAEARTMARIKHHGVVAVHDYHSDPSLAFLVMEYVEGESLSRRLHRFGRLDPVRTMSIVAQAADALQSAHDKGVVHRDVKPGNLLVTAGDQIVLTDFGIARSVAAAPLTATGAVVGTVSYLAPEQVLGKPATARSDLYALGVVAYECLSGRRPFDGDNPFEIAMKRVRGAPPALGSDVPPAVRAVVDRALAADPEQRWATAEELARAARRAASAGSAGRATVPGQRSAPPEGVGASAATPVPRATSVPPATLLPPPPVPAPAAAPQPPPSYPPSTSYPATGYPATGYPPPGPRPPYQPPSQQQNTAGLLAMIFGILGIVFGVCCWLLGAPLSAAGIVLGAIGMRKVNEGLADNRWMALAGVICGSVGAGLSIIFLFLYAFADFSTTG